MIKNTQCYLGMPITVQASLGLRDIVGCAMRTAKLMSVGLFRCARRTLRSLYPAPVVLVRHAG